VLHHCEVVVLEGDSYRMREARNDSGHVRA
jgi:hypothetical protein